MCKCVTKVLKEKVMLFAKALPCRIKHVLCHISSDQSLSGFSSCNPSESSEHRHQVNQVGEIVHGCHVLRPTVLLQDVKRMISDIVRYCPISMISWWFMKIQQMSRFFLKSLRWFHKLLEAWMISMEHPIETSEMPSWWFGDSQVGRFSRLASFYRSLSRGKNLWCQEARRKSKPSWQTWLSCHMLGTWGYTIWDTLKLQTLRHSTISMCRSDSLMLDQRIYRLSMHCRHDRHIMTGLWGQDHCWD